MENNNFCLEVENWLGVRILIDENHSFAEEVPLDDFLLVHRFNAEAVRLACLRLFDFNSFAVY